MQDARCPIGVFDSGVGGLTVVRALRAVLPAEDILYLGDTARVPYGSKSPETVIRYSVSCARFLLERQIKMLVVACNTATAHALPALRASLGVPVVGAVEPGARAAHTASKTGRIGVVGTLGTIRSGAYVEALRKLNHGAVITGQPCPLLVPLAEEGWTDGPVVHAVAAKYLHELAAMDASIDTLVLGCTHYPLLVSVLARVAEEAFGRPVKLVDSASVMASTTRATLAELGLLAPAGEQFGKLKISVTDASRLSELAPRFLGEPVTSFETVDLWDKPA